LVREGDGLKKLGAYIRRNEQGEVVEVVFNFNDITDAGLVHLKGLTKLQALRIGGFGSENTNAGLEHLRALTELQMLHLMFTKITDAGITDLKKALPNCKIVILAGISKAHDPPTR
jgi:hypothetical protein